jgi:glutamate-1-semialdehyde 2,1-aminomutase
LDGNRLIDYSCGTGAVVLGHGDDAVAAAVATAVAEGTLFGVGTTLSEVMLAERVVECIPSAEKVLFCSTGSAATAAALRLARAVTGREKIIKMQGCYHGDDPNLLMNIHSGPGMVGHPDPHSSGMLPATINNTVVCRYNDLDSVSDALLAHAGQVAALIVEPIAHNGPTLVPADGYLQGLRDLCTEHGVILIFDEVITAFRHGLSGYQEIAGVLPDLTTAGKAIANGVPLALIAGPSKLMDRFTTAPDGDVAWAGTYNGNALATAAGLATIDRLSDGTVHAHIARLGDRLRDGLRGIIAEMGVPATVTGYGSILTTWFAEGPIESYDDVLRGSMFLFSRFRQELRLRGIWAKADIDGARCCVGASHTDEDVDITLDAARDSLRAALDQTARQH